MQHLIAEQPLREQLWGHLIVALYRCGRQAEALAAYRECRRRLVDELGIEPGPALRRLERDVLHQAGSLELPSSGAGAEAGGTPFHQPQSTAAPTAPPAHNLPVAITSFVGRTRELAELIALVGESRLVTVIGVGGVGKTRLAVELARAVVDDHPDGVWLAQLAAISDPALVAEEVNAAAGVPSDAMLGRSARPEDRLCAHLRTSRALVVLDNCEHLLEAAAGVAQALLEACPGVRVVTTSREVLGLGGEVVWSVPPLSLPPAGASAAGDLNGSDAVALLCDRARGARAGFAVSAANAAAVARICRRLDGIPLALELAAARLRVLSAQQVAERLDDRFRLLTGGGRAALPRHQTLRAAMDWSYEALPAPEQGLLRCLAVFPGNFDLAAAEAVARDDMPHSAEPGFEALDLLSRLVDKSLVVVQPTGADARYQLLETVREYASERLEEAGETHATHRRHRDHFVAVAALHPGGWWADEIGPLLRWAEVDDHNLTAACAWSLEQGEHEHAVHLAARIWIYWHYGARWDATALLERALSRADPPLTPDRVEATIALATMLAQSDQCGLGRPERLLRDALQMAERLGDRSGRIHALCILGHIALIRGDAVLADRLLRDALDGCGDGNRMERGVCRYMLGQAALTAGDVDRAMRHLEEALRLARAGLPLLVPQVLAALAPLAALAGEAPRAETLADEAVRTAAQLGLPAVTALAMTRATEARIVTGDTLTARSTLRELLQLLAEVGGLSYVADALEMAALLAEGDGRTPTAARLLATCRALRDAHGEPLGGTRAVTGLVRDCAARALGQETEGRGWPSTAGAIAGALSELDGTAVRPR